MGNFGGIVEDEGAHRYLEEDIYGHKGQWNLGTDEGAIRFFIRTSRQHQIIILVKLRARF